MKKQNQEIHNLRFHLKSNYNTLGCFADFHVYLLVQIFLLIHLSCYSWFNFPSLKDPGYHPVTNYMIFKSLCDPEIPGHNILLTFAFLSIP